eukprot:CAMPEP_0175884446 /NCGR_PEP_ID=MMETSP0107_2-20121207/44523_1 /TAXON_ID=195067 ORGANISM="Goniomonas pacifica, Strain CCMP1869" /NCGR_SAMPLE_ID=MMETSP0107_2 /ASSEMBLY_ACC=CAM_ASM_000203 /LENGTH=68 /DNA_ID=CAMNT_0017204593 /DNA_START=437 /DNA_END=643 /DNA_ORIENTATION=-
MLRGPLQGGVTVWATRIDVSLCVKEEDDTIEVAVFSCRDDRRVSVGVGPLIESSLQRSVVAIGSIIDV